MPVAYEVRTWSDSSTDAVFATRSEATDYATRRRADYADDPSIVGRSDGVLPTWEVREVLRDRVRVCAICNTYVVTAKDPDTDFCRFCYYSGSADERNLAPLLDRLRGLEGINAEVWHTGGGCMVLAVWNSAIERGSPDGPFITAVEGYRREDGSGGWDHGDPTLPAGPEGPWGADVWPSEAHWSGEVEDYDWTSLVTLEAPANADALVRFVQDNLVGEGATR